MSHADHAGSFYYSIIEISSGSSRSSNRKYVFVYCCYSMFSLAQGIFIWLLVATMLVFI